MTARAARRLALVTALGLLAPAAGVRAQGRQSPDVALQAAVHTELVEGNLERAIQLYRNIATNHAANRAVAANALVYMGRAYEKLGRAEARRAYEQVVRDYADQAEPAAIARARLQNLSVARREGAAEQQHAPTYTLLLPEFGPLDLRHTAQFDFSPSGDRVVFRSRLRGTADTSAPAELYVADRSGTVIRPLLRDAGPWRYFRTPRWSPDGRTIAFWAARPTSATEDSVEATLMLVNPDDGVPRPVRPAFLQSQGARPAFAWHPGGDRLTFFVPTGLVTIDLAGRTLDSVPMRNRWSTQFGGFSPDGRWLVYHVMNEGTEQQRELDAWVVPSRGGGAVQVTNAPGLDGHPTFARDGRAIYFVSDRSGSSNVWRQAIDPATATPIGEPEQLTTYSDALAAYPTPLGDGRRVAYVLQRSNGAVQVAPTANPAERRALARGRSPQISPDGRTVYYVGEGVGEEGIWAIPAAGGAPRRLTAHRPAASYLRVFHLSPDGRAIAYFSRVDGRMGLYIVPTAGGEPQPLLRFDSREDLSPEWSPDGSQLAYAAGGGLWVIAATGGAPRSIAQLRGWEGWTARWSPDGRYIAALGYERPDEENAVFVVPAAGGELRRLTPPEEREYKEGLEWHPDGRRLTYMYYHNGGGDGTRQVFLEGGPSTLLVNQSPPLWDYVGRWSPDGRRYYFTSSPGGPTVWSLYAYEEATGRTSLVSSTGGAVGSEGLPSFSRDGQTMVWTSTRTVNQLWVMENFR